MRSFWAAVGASGALVAGALAVVGPASATTPRASGPTCTRSALQAGLARGAEPKPHDGKVVRPFGCASGWAYAAVETPRFEYTALFRVQGGRWATVDRGPACSHGRVPRSIRHPACDTN